MISLTGGQLTNATCVACQHVLCLHGLSHTVMMKAWEVSFLSQALWCREITGDWVLRDAEQFSPLQTTAGAATCDVVSGAWDQDLLTWKVLLRAAWAWGASWPGAVVSA